MTILPDSPPESKQEIPPSVFDTPPDVTHWEVQALWQRARDTQNARLAGSILAADRMPHTRELPVATLALLIDAHAAAAAGIGYAAWVDELGSWLPAGQAIHAAEAFPRLWYFPPEGEQPAGAGDPLADLNPATVITRKRLAEIRNVAERTIARWITAGDLPKPHHRGRETYWLAGELQEVQP